MQDIYTGTRDATFELTETLPTTRNGYPPRGKPILVKQGANQKGRNPLAATAISHKGIAAVGHVDPDGEVRPTTSKSAPIPELETVPQEFWKYPRIF